MAQISVFPSSAAVAQVTVNHLVVGSNPTSGAIFQGTLTAELCSFIIGISY